MIQLGRSDRMLHSKDLTESRLIWLPNWIKNEKSGLENRVDVILTVFVHKLFKRFKISITSRWFLCKYADVSAMTVAFPKYIERPATIWYSARVG